MGLSHSPSTVTDGLVFCLDAANKRSYPGTGAVWTDLAGSNNGTLINEPIFDADDKGSIIFDGTDEYISIGDVLNDVLDGTDYSAMGWVKWDGSNSCIILGKETSQSAGSQYCTYGGVDSAGKVIATWSQSRTQRIIAYSEDSITSNEFVHIAWAYDQDFSPKTERMKMWVNGVKQSYGTPYQAGDPAGWWNKNATLCVGAAGEYSGTVQAVATGNISSALLYNRLLSDKEVVQNYLATRGRYS